MAYWLKRSLQAHISSYLIPQVSSPPSLLPVHRDSDPNFTNCFHVSISNPSQWVVAQELTPYRILAVFVGSLPLLAHSFCSLVANLLPYIFLLPLLKTNSASPCEHCFLPATNALEARAFGHPGSAGSDTTSLTGSIQSWWTLLHWNYSGMRSWIWG